MQFSLPVPLALQNSSRRAILYMIFSAFCFAAVELAGNFYVRNITAPQLIWGRYAAHLLFMMAVLGPRYKARLVKTSRIKLQIVRSLTMLAMPVCFLLAVTHMPTNDVWSVYWLSPAIMLLLSTLLLHEPVGNTRWIICVIAFVGALLVYRPDRGIITPYAIFAFGCGLAIALHLALSRILREDHPLTSLFHTALWVFLSLSVFVPFIWKTPALTDLIGIVLVGLIGMVGLFTLARAGELVPLSVVAVFSYAEVIWDLLLKGLFLGVLPGKSELVGTILITVVLGFLLYREFSQPHVEIEPVIEPI